MPVCVHPYDNIQSKSRNNWKINWTFFRLLPYCTKKSSAVSSLNLKGINKFYCAWYLYEYRNQMLKLNNSVFQCRFNSDEFSMRRCTKHNSFISLMGVCNVNTILTIKNRRIFQYIVQAISWELSLQSAKNNEYTQQRYCAR